MLGGTVTLSDHLEKLVGTICEIETHSNTITLKLVTQNSQAKAQFENLKKALEILLFIKGNATEKGITEQDETSFTFVAPSNLDAIDIIYFNRIYASRFSTVNEAAQKFENSVLQELSQRLMQIAEREEELNELEHKLRLEQVKMEEIKKNAKLEVKQHDIEKNSLRRQIDEVERIHSLAMDEIAHNEEQLKEQKNEIRNLRKEKEARVALSNELEEVKHQLKMANEELLGKNKKIKELEKPNNQSENVQKVSEQSLPMEIPTSSEKLKKTEQAPDLSPRVQELEEELKIAKENLHFLAKEKKELLELTEQLRKEALIAKQKFEEKQFEQELEHIPSLADELRPLNVQENAELQQKLKLIEERSKELDEKSSAIEKQILKSEQIANKIDLDMKDLERKKQQLKEQSSAEEEKTNQARQEFTEKSEKLNVGMQGLQLGLDQLSEVRKKLQKDEETLNLREEELKRKETETEKLKERTQEMEKKSRDLDKKLLELEEKELGLSKVPLTLELKERELREKEQNLNLAFNDLQKQLKQLREMQERLLKQESELKAHEEMIKRRELELHSKENNKAKASKDEERKQKDAYKRREEDLNKREQKLQLKEHEVEEKLRDARKKIDDENLESESDESDEDIDFSSKKSKSPSLTPSYDKRPKGKHHSAHGRRGKKGKLHAHENAKTKGKREYDKRLEQQKKIYQGPNAPESTSREGAMQKAAHLAGLTPEGVAGEILTIYVVNILQLLFQTQFIIQKSQFKRAQDAGIAYQLNEETGLWPEVYPLDENGQPNFNAAPYEDGKAPAQAVIGNGLIPPPDIYRALADQWKQYELQMWGTTSKSERDLASDMRAMSRTTPK